MESGCRSVLAALLAGWQSAPTESGRHFPPPRQRCRGRQHRPRRGRGLWDAAWLRSWVCRVGLSQENLLWTESCHSDTSFMYPRFTFRRSGPHGQTHAHGSVWDTWSSGPSITDKIMCVHRAPLCLVFKQKLRTAQYNHKQRLFNSYSIVCALESI